MRDGHRAVGTNSGGTHYMVRGSRMVDTTSGETALRVRDDGSVEDTDTGKTRFRVRDDGRGRIRARPKRWPGSVIGQAGDQIVITRLRNDSGVSSR